MKMELTWPWKQGLKLHDTWWKRKREETRDDQGFAIAEKKGEWRTYTDVGNTGSRGK